MGAPIVPLPTGAGHGGPPDDVPAIKAKHDVPADCNSHGDSNISTAMYCVGFTRAEEYDTCADKSRILFTAEDGTKWCHAPTKPEAALVWDEKSGFLTYHGEIIRSPFMLSLPLTLQPSTSDLPWLLADGNQKCLECPNNCCKPTME
jgi:hypothetical protein